jgi:hypothetical protein
MHDFASRVSASVQAARGLTQQRLEAQRQEEEEAARRMKHGRDRAAELVVTTWERVRTAAQASDGALTVDRREKDGVTTFELHWQEGPPPRSLLITVDQPDGMIQAAWVVASVYGRSVDAPSVSASEFDVSKLEAVILVFVDQPRWAHSAIPTIPW